MTIATSTGPQGPVTVLGAGSWGTALALLLAGGDAPGPATPEVRLWDRSPSLIAALAADHENRKYLPGAPLPQAIRPLTDIAEALQDAVAVVVAVPSGAVRAVLTLAAPYLTTGVDIILAAKGLEADTAYLPFQVAAEVLGLVESAPKATRSNGTLALVGLSGPNLAGEIVRGVPAAAVAACPEEDAAERVAALFNRPAFRVYTSTDRVGVEVGGAVKNVLAIAGGVSDGLGFGDNAKAALLTRGLAEMSRFGVALGARRETFYGLTGVGDLMATAASRLSRNWRVGEGLARGESLPEILARLGQVAEGVPTAHAVTQLAAEKGVEMPVCTAVARLLQGAIAPREAVTTLMTRVVAREE